MHAVFRGTSVALRAPSAAFNARSLATKGRLFVDAIDRRRRG
jgi:hypothetical protein